MKNRIASFRYALNGLKIAYLEEPNFRIHILALIVVVIAGIYLNIELRDWMILVLTSIIVIITELLNTAIENVCDFIHAEQNVTIGRIKDVCAAAVLISAIGAIVVGAFVFYPYII